MTTSIAIVAFGTRGDTQPYVEFGAGLAARGYKVRIACNDAYKNLADEAGLECVPLDVDPAAAARTDEGKELLAAGRDMAGLTDAIVKIVGPGAAAAFGRMAEACSDVDVIIGTPPGLVPYSVAEKRQVPYVIVRSDAVYPTRAFPHWAISRSFGPFNRMTYPMAEQMLWRGLKGLINGFRQDALGLAALPNSSPFSKMRAEGIPTLFNFSTAVVPPPRDWPSQAVVSGWWFSPTPQGYQPPEDLAGFLDAGDPPVYVSLGTESPGVDQQELGTMVREALRHVGVRGVLLGDPAEIASDSDLFVMSGAPYDWLMPKLAAVVHHAGSQTIGAVLRAGLPSVPCPVFSDQPFWAQRLYDLGVATQPIPAKMRTADRLAKGITAALSDSPLRERAAEVGRVIAAEDGVGRACDVLTSWLARDPAVPRPVRA
jgi:UDP:flavonoid glycosyltransferase YjiC (YdhE family)